MASEVVFKNACAETVIPLLQFVDGVKVTDARSEHDSNAYISMDVTDAGMVMEVITVCWNALLPISVTDEGMVTVVIPDCWNALFPMVNSPLFSISANVTVVRLAAR